MQLLIYSITIPLDSFWYEINGLQGFKRDLFPVVSGSLFFNELPGRLIFLEAYI